MNLLLALGLSIGVLAGLWGQVSSMIGLITWVGFISWASFYAAGGKKEGLLKAVASNLSGVLWGFLIGQLVTILGGFPYALGVAIAIGCFIMVVQANISVLSLIPGAFAGCASFFGTNGDWEGTAIALVAGAVLGYISEIIGVALSNIGKKETDAGK